MKSAAVRELEFRVRALRRVILLAAGAVCSSAFAQVDGATFDAPVAARAEQPLARVELSTVTLPRLDGLDNGSSQGARVNLSVLPPRKSSFGVAVGMAGLSPATGLAGQPMANPVNVDLGLMYRHTTESNHQVDVTAWRRVNPVPDDAITLVQQRQQPAYAASVQLNLAKVRKAGLTFDRGIGFQLQSGAKVSLRKKDGGAMLYYRSQF
jgi:hypothetical protein